MAIALVGTTVGSAYTSFGTSHTITLDVAITSGNAVFFIIAFDRSGTLTGFSGDFASATIDYTAVSFYGNNTYFCSLTNITSSATQILFSSSVSVATYDFFIEVTGASSSPYDSGSGVVNTSTGVASLTNTVSTSVNNAFIWQFIELGAPKTFVADSGYTLELHGATALAMQYDVDVGASGSKSVIASWTGGTADATVASVAYKPATSGGSTATTAWITA